LTTDRWRLLSSLYHSVLARPTNERRTYLRDACAGDERLQREVEALVDADSERALVDTPAVEAAARVLADENPGDWPRVRELFEGALALPASERHAYLETACRTNIAIREQVERMLESHQKASGFLERSPELTSTDATSEVFEGQRLGPYQLVSRLGAGGMGVVFRALDTRLARSRSSCCPPRQLAIRWHANGSSRRREPLRR
jgi:hypothetical protein